MIGTGVFTSLGFQVADLHNTWTIVLLWAIGGLVALTGAFSYAEVGALYKRSGGEYHFLSKLYHPLVGYLTGWVSMTVGFAAPVALAAVAMCSYLNLESRAVVVVAAIAVIVALSAVHSLHLRRSSQFQNIVTVLKVLLIVAIVASGIVMEPDQPLLETGAGWLDEITLPAFAVSLVFVTYSYSGWNAAAYIVEEISDVRRNLPRALVRGTLLVIALYIAINFVFLKHTPIEAMANEIDIGQIFAKKLFGLGGGTFVAGLIAFFLLSSISAMVWVGPRVVMAMGEDYRLWRFLKTKNKAGVPVAAIWFQALLSCAMILTGTFEQIIVYCGFLLQGSAALTVFGSFLLRARGIAMPFKSPFHPVFPLIFTAISAWILIYLLINNPLESLLGLSNIVLGLITWWINRAITNEKQP